MTETDRGDVFNVIAALRARVADLEQWKAAAIERGYPWSVSATARIRELEAALAPRAPGVYGTPPYEMAATREPARCPACGVGVRVPAPVGGGSLSSCAACGANIFSCDPLGRREPVPPSEYRTERAFAAADGTTVTESDLPKPVPCATCGGSGRVYASAQANKFAPDSASCPACRTGGGA
mgnify:CR=1 FL=1